MQPSALRRAAAKLGVALEEFQIDRLLRYVALLERWNARFNLISRKDIGRIWPRHILDSLSILPYLSPTAVTPGPHPVTAIDIGTGAGLPGIPLAIAGPGVQWRLIDRNQRKIRFLEIVIATLELENVQAQALDLGAGSVDEPVGKADLVVSRAVDDPAGLLPVAVPLLGPRGRMILMTGAAGSASGSEELPECDGFRVQAVHPVAIPGLDRTHEVTIMERAHKRRQAAEPATGAVSISRGRQESTE